MAIPRSSAAGSGGAVRAVSRHRDAIRQRRHEDFITPGGNERTHRHNPIKFAMWLADAWRQMSQMPVFYPRGYFPPATNAERQREFRERNPDYYRLLHAKRRAAIKARADARRLAAQEAEALAAQDALAIETRTAATVPAQETLAERESVAVQEVVIAPEVLVAREATAAPLDQESTPPAMALTIPQVTTQTIPATNPPAKPMLCLPPPVVCPMMEQLNALARLHKLRREAEALIGTPR